MHTIFKWFRYYKINFTFVMLLPDKAHWVAFSSLPSPQLSAPSQVNVNARHCKLEQRNLFQPQVPERFGKMLHQKLESINCKLNIVLCYLKGLLCNCDFTFANSCFITVIFAIRYSVTDLWRRNTLIVSAQERMRRAAFSWKLK